MLSIHSVKPAFRSLLTLIFITLSQSAVATKGKISLLNTCHDGYCFYHAVNALTQHSTSAQALCDELTTFVSNQDNTEALAVLLQTEPIASSTNDLRRQTSCPIQLGDRSNWPSQAHVVAMSLLLNTPILVLVLQGHQLSSNSFMVSSEGVFPFDSLISQNQSSSIQVPQIQLVLVGENWLALNYQPGSQAPNLFEYIAQIMELISMIQQNVNESDSLILVGEADLTTPEDFSIAYNWVITSYSIVQHWLQNMEVQASSQMHQISERSQRRVITSTFDISGNDFSCFQFVFRTQFQVILDPITLQALGNSMNDYLIYSGLDQPDFLSQLDPEQHQVWPLLEELHQILPGLVSRNLSTQTLGGTIGTYCIASQKKEVSQLADIQFRGRPPQLPSGIVHPGNISMSTSRWSVTFDKKNPVHHVFFTLYVTARLYDIADFGLLQLINAVASLNSGETIEVTPGVIVTEASPNHQVQLDRLRMLRTHIDTVLDNLHVVIHALGQRHFDFFWHPGRYVCITIEDQDFIVFHSDDFAPRGGWKHLWPAHKKKKFKKK